MWKKLTVDDLKLVLSEDEVKKLETKSTTITDRINKQLEIISNLFRGAWKAKGYAVDVRDYFVAPEYITPILNYARWQIWTTFPATENISLSENRKVGYDEAVELLKNPYIQTSKPDYSNDPVLSADTELNKIEDGAILLPYLKIDSPFSGFIGKFEKFI